MRFFETYVNTDGTPAKGQVMIAPLVPYSDRADEVRITGRWMVVPLDENGRVDITVPDLDPHNVEPTPMAYRIIEDVSCSPHGRVQWQTPAFLNEPEYWLGDLRPPTDAPPAFGIRGDRVFLVKSRAVTQAHTIDPNLIVDEFAPGGLEDRKPRDFDVRLWVENGEIILQEHSSGRWRKIRNVDSDDKVLVYDGTVLSVFLLEV